MSNSIKRQVKKQTTQEKIDQIGRVQFEMWIKLDIMSKEVRKMQDMLGVTDEEVDKESDEELNEKE